MRFARRSVPVVLFALLLACSGASRPAVATADTKRSPPPDEHPLVPYDLKDDADYTRALREFYTKYEFRIPMRDGKLLFTDAYVPKDHSHTYPIIMLRTPYGLAPYGVDNVPQPGTRPLPRFAPAREMVKDGYVWVHQDVRGRMMSEGEFVDVRPMSTTGGTDESTDAYDTVDYLVKNVPNNNGKVGVWGISYPGFYAAQAAVNAHPAVKAVSPQAPVTEWFLGDDFHHNGAFFLADSFDFTASFGKPRPEPVKKWRWEEGEPSDAYDFFLALGPIENTQTKYLKNGIPFYNDLFAHPNRDAFWKARDPRPFYKNAKPAIMTVGGLFDAEDLWGALETYRSYEKQSPATAQNTIVLGPWRHGGWLRTDGDVLGDIRFGAKTSLFFQSQIEAPFFARALKGKDVARPKEAWVYDTGLCEWRGHEVWPPRAAKPVFLSFRTHGALSAAPLGDADVGEGSDAYPSDPAKPVPYRARASSTIDEDYMTDDQRFASRRPDVLVYQTPPLTDVAELVGPITADLWVDTTGTDADFIVKLVDVWPDDAEDPQPNPLAVKMAGYQELVRFEIMRGRFRNSFETPQAMKPGEPTRIQLTLPDVAHTFRAGHRLMVQVQSSMFPLIDRNPQTFVDIYKAKEADFKPATHRVYHTRDHNSGIKVLMTQGRL